VFELVELPTYDGLLVEFKVDKGKASWSAFSLAANRDNVMITFAIFHLVPGS
jgi:hypothetical protein